MVDNENHHSHPIWVPSTKEQRFATSFEQMKVLLDKIRDDDDSDYSNYTPENEMHEMPEDCEESEQTKRESDPVKGDSNFIEEYVNFIDLSALNPVIDPADCQNDDLIESEIRELHLFCVFMFNVVVARLKYSSQKIRKPNVQELTAE